MIDMINKGRKYN